MIWVDREVKHIKEHNLPLEWVDDMKTPSGRVHVGALRGVVIHDLLYKVMKEQGMNARFSYVFNNMDSMDAIPSYLDYDKWEQYAGMPLNKIPSPEKGFKNFAEYYAQEFRSVFESINCHPEIILSSELYESGRMNDVIKEALDKASAIREVYKRVAKADRPADWLPFQVICEKCGKVGTTNAFKWDGEKVHYRCMPDMVKWAQGCGHEGAVSPFDGRGKLHWRVDWPAHWKVIGVTVEGSGKDHMSSGGSYDMAVALCNEVFDYRPAYAVPYEWFTIGGKKMSSSKGIGSAAKDVAGILPPDVFRFLIVRTPVGTHLDFDPYGDTILNIFDDYDRCLNAHFDKVENKIPEGKQGEVLTDFARIIELSQVMPLPKKRLFIPRFRTVANVVKTNADTEQFFEKQKGSKLTAAEKKILKERVQYAKIYLKDYASPEEKIQFNTALPSGLTLTDNQKIFLKELLHALKNTKDDSRETLQEIIFSTVKKTGFKPKEVFPAFYRILINRDFGPKAGELIHEYGLKKTIALLEEALQA